MLGWLAAYKYVTPTSQVGMAFVWVCVRNRQEKLPQLLVSSSLDESKNSPTTKSENSATNNNYLFTQPRSACRLPIGLLSSLPFEFTFILNHKKVNMNSFSNCQIDICWICIHNFSSVNSISNKISTRHTPLTKYIMRERFRQKWCKNKSRK